MKSSRTELTAYKETLMFLVNELLKKASRQSNRERIVFFTNGTRTIG
jgi:hypothetical protein